MAKADCVNFCWEEPTLAKFRRRIGTKKLKKNAKNKRLNFCKQKPLSVESGFLFGYFVRYPVIVTTVVPTPLDVAAGTVRTNELDEEGIVILFDESNV